jgi:16S rRNA C967 or C1407 C5-methylase (RsmB/RsmF family)
LDLSSVFSVVPLLEWGNGGEAVLDVCAAPGGKSILVWRGLAPRVLFANEVIHKRVRPLIANLSRCQVSEAAALSVESDRLAELFSAALELVVVDAPCSGQSLLVKGMSVPGCFHPQTINMNANRQKRILANAGKCVAKDGLLAYMTCTYSREENEGVCEWFLKRFPEFSLLPSNNLAQYQSTLTSLPCYRLWPWQGEGAGSFTALFRRLDGETKPLVSPPSLWCSMQR